MQCRGGERSRLGAGFGLRRFDGEDRRGLSGEGVGVDVRGYGGIGEEGCRFDLLQCVVGMWIMMREEEVAGVHCGGDGVVLPVGVDDIIYGNLFMT